MEFLSDGPHFLLFLFLFFAASSLAVAACRRLFCTDKREVMNSFFNSCRNGNKQIRTDESCDESGLNTSESSKDSHPKDSGGFF